MTGSTRQLVFGQILIWFSYWQAMGVLQNVSVTVRYSVTKTIRHQQWQCEKQIRLPNKRLYNTLKSFNKRKRNINIDEKFKTKLLTLFKYLFQYHTKCHRVTLTNGSRKWLQKGKCNGNGKKIRLLHHNSGSMSLHIRWQRFLLQIAS